jgi:hypothetical protein
MARHASTVVLCASSLFLLVAVSIPALAQDCPSDSDGALLLCLEGETIIGRFPVRECSSVITTIRQALASCSCYLGSEEARSGGPGNTLRAKNQIASYLRQKPCQVQ